MVTSIEPDFVKSKWWDEVKFKLKTDAPDYIKKEYKEWLESLNMIKEE